MAEASRLKLLLEEIRYEQTLFSLPLIYVAALFGSNFSMSLRQVVLIAVAAASARALGMLLNRIVDASIDRLNPRTKNRYIASGKIDISQAVFFAVASLVAYLLSAYLLGPLPLLLSPIPVIFFFVYPYTKRFTWGCHFFLGLAHGLAPLAGWIAVNPSFSLAPFLLYATSFFWVSGFDVYYATMDYEFDKKHGIYSLPALIGLEKVPVVTITLHVLASVFLLTFAFLATSSVPFRIASVASVIYLLFNDMRHARFLATPVINRYLQLNSYFSVILFAGALVEFLSRVF